MMRQHSSNRGSLRRGATGMVAGVTLAFGMLVGVAPSVSAQPTDSTETQAPGMSADQVLSVISQEYQTGAGGGQVSKLIEQVITLRSRGIRPSTANTAALTAALDARPNQKPLIEALQSTLTYQRKQLARAQAPQQPQQQSPGPQINMGTTGPAWAPNQGNPMIQDGDTIFPMPGR